VTRFLALFHGPEKVTAADIQAPAVRFLEQHLGVRTLLSPPRAHAFAPGRTFGMVVAHSFFSHMPERSFREWLERLYRLVQPGGALVFSVHDDSLIINPADRDPSGITFRPISETNRLHGEVYGSTWVSANFVENAVRTSCAGAALLRWPRGLRNFQDLYVVSDRPIDPTTVLDQGPSGFFSISRVKGDVVELIGWAAHSNPERAVTAIVVSINGKQAQLTTSFSARPDVVAHTGQIRHLKSGWRCQFRLPHRCSLGTDILTVTARSDTGVDSTLYVGTIAMALLERCRSELAAAGRESVIFRPETADDYEEKLFGLRAGIEVDEPTRQQAEDMATKVFAIEPESSEGHRILGLIAISRGDLPAGIRALHRSLDRNGDDAETLGWLSFMYSMIGRTDLAHPLARHVQQIAPSALMSLMSGIVVPWMEGDFGEALRVVRLARKSETGASSGDYLEMLMLALLGQTGDAIASGENFAKGLSGTYFANLGRLLLHALRGERAQGLALLETNFVATSRSDPQYSLELAHALSLLGESDAALDWLENAMNRGFLGHQYIARHDPFLASLRGDARFLRVVESMRSRQFRV
jgi:tetratricopeptide (TPR) repeat protein